MEHLPPQYLLPLFIVAWLAAMHAISRIGGWSVLAMHYPEAEPHQGPKLRFQSASLRWMMGYNTCLVFGPGADGLHISVALPMRPAHPPLMIPWHEIRAERFAGRLMKGYRLHFQRCPDIPFAVTDRLMGRIAAAMGGAAPIHGLR